MLTSSIEAVLRILLSALGFWLALHFIAPEPSPELLRSVAEIGAALLIAFAIVTSWIVRITSKLGAKEPESRLGGFTVFGAMGLLGICFALALAERAAVHHWTWLDEAAFALAVTSLAALGVVVVLQPILTHEWVQATEAAPPDGDQK